MGDFVFLGSKITADGDYRHKIKRCLLLGRKVMTNLDYFWLCWVFVAVGELSPVVVNGGNSLVVVCGFLIALASLVAEHRL